MKPPYRLKKLYILIISVALMLTFGAVLLQRLSRQQPILEEAALARARQAFAEAVALVRLQWQQQGRPAQLSWRGKDIGVNRLGWPQPPEGDCEALWRLLLDGRPRLLATPIAITERPGPRGDRLCHYRLGAWGFSYWPGSGRVTTDS
ncbi:hypothetical protein [Gallaecimonas sp. GXIMD4217]|uniref:hypothetical protein n=1 Tax=Gallaecimonas sp. GXIMD4217 TaxID=3131927 RepID=UPI00311AC0D2